MARNVVSTQAAFTLLVINLLRRRLRDGDLHAYALESKFYAERVGLTLDRLRQLAALETTPIKF